VQRGYKKENLGNRVTFVRESGEKRVGWRDPPFREDLSAAAEESLLLEAVTRERLLKTQQAGKFREGCGDLWIAEIIGGAVIACSYESCVEWSINPIFNPKPSRVSHTYYETIHTNIKKNNCHLNPF
jgi:hypothetical protein